MILPSNHWHKKGSAFGLYVFIILFIIQAWAPIYAQSPPSANLNVTVAPSGGAGCSDPSTLVGLPSGWSCDSALSDDFNGSGAADSSKWQRQSWYPNCGSAVTIHRDSGTNTGFQSGGAYHVTLSSTDGHTFTWGDNLTMRSAWGSRAGYGFPPNYYIEYRMRLVNSGISGFVESVFVSFGVFPAPPPGTVITSAHDSPAYTMMELDVPESNMITWGKWNVAAGGATTGGGVILHDPSSLPTNSLDGNWHVLGWMRNGGLFSFFEDGSIYRSSMTPPDPDFATSSDNWGYGPYLLGGCPGGTGTYDLQVDYVHVYHP